MQPARTQGAEVAYYLLYNSKLIYSQLKICLLKVTQRRESNIVFFWHSNPKKSPAKMDLIDSKNKKI
jgi:hypothetical protein